jgi:asparagine synthase (glutamine-hydrolysing)
MCGIFVVINKKFNVLNLNRCMEALDTLKNRGPNFKFHKILAPNIFMGQTVLSMTGKAKRDINQYYSNNKNKFIVFNGEIYNYEKLSETYLNSKVHKDNSDAKILVNLIDKVNIKNLNTLLDGMYVFVVFDKLKNQLILNRDPQGEKIIYIYEDNEDIILSSEIKSIINYTKKAHINKNILKNYFYTRHLIQFDKTIFKNIKILEQGHLKVLDLKSFKFKLLSAYSLGDMISPADYNHNLKRKENDLVEELDFLLEKNTKQMIPNLRKFASVVSGGIDSSLLSHYICKNSSPQQLICLNHVGKEMFSHCIKIFEKELKFKINHYDIYVKDYYLNLIEALTICNGPIHSHSFVGQLIMAKIINKYGCKALFVGEGADELFGGYDTYRQKINNPKINQSNYSKILKSNLFLRDNEFYEFKSNINKHWKNSLEKYNFIENEDHKNRLAMMLMDSTTQLSSNGLRGADLMSMAHSIETRSVFLRRDIVKFALNLPLRFKLDLKSDNLLNTKILLKKVFLKHFSKKLIFKKQGFSGFPNETSQYLGNKNDYLIKKLFKIKNYKKKIVNLDRGTEWKLINTEMFLSNVVKLNKSIKF